MYTIELNIADCTVRLVDKMKTLGEENGFQVTHHGWDHLVFRSDRGINFTKLINELDMLCKYHGVDYVSLLV